MRKESERRRENPAKFREGRRESGRIAKNTGESEIMREKPRNLGNPRNEKNQKNTKIGENPNN